MQITHQSPSSLPLLNGAFVASCQGGGPQKYVTQAGHIAVERTVHAAATAGTALQTGCLRRRVWEGTFAGSGRGGGVICRRSETGPRLAVGELIRGESVTLSVRRAAAAATHPSSRGQMGCEAKYVTGINETCAFLSNIFKTRIKHGCFDMLHIFFQIYTNLIHKYMYFTHTSP